MDLELAQDILADSRKVAKSPQRSRIANGSQFLPLTDGRSAWARLQKETFLRLVQHCGGPDAISETQRLDARRVSTLEAELCYMEDAFCAIRAAGNVPDPASVDLYGRLADRQRRLSDPLGWSRTPRDVTPSISNITSEYIDAAND
jgi:hypothetical protein